MGDVYEICFSLVDEFKEETEVRRKIEIADYPIEIFLDEFKKFLITAGFSEDIVNKRIKYVE